MSRNQIVVNDDFLVTQAASSSVLIKPFVLRLFYHALGA